MATRLVSGGRIKSDGTFEAYDKATKSYTPVVDNTSETGDFLKVNKDDFGKTEVGGRTQYTGSNAQVGSILNAWQPLGITTSDDAANRGKAADETINNITAPGADTESPFADLFSRINDLQSKLNKAKEAEQAAKEAQANQDAQVKLAGTPSAEEAASGAEADMSAATDAIGGKGTTDNIQDATIRALADKTIANVGIISNQMQTLEQYRKQFNEYTQQDIDSIARTAERSIQRQMEENERTTNAMRFAGVLGGRAQFAPVTEQSIIAEVIQDGLDKIEVINEKKNTAIREARKAEAEFNIDAFEQQAELAKEYNNEIESTISAMNARVRQVEQDERERITFRQEQEERNSLILAEELIDATPEKIAETAAANGINVGLLTKAVNDAKFEKANREFEAKNQALTLRDKELSIANRAADLSERGSDEPVEIPEDVEQGLRSVAQLSQKDREDIWLDIQDFGLNQDAVAFWLEDRAFSKSQVKGIIKAHEQSQRVKGMDESGEESLLPTETEQALFKFVDEYKTATNKKAEQELSDIVSKRKYASRKDEEKKVESKYGGDEIMSPETFFKRN